MTPKEMLIGIDLIGNKLNSNSIFSMSDEEKLWFLNEEQLRFIKQRINPLSNDKRLGLQDNQKRYDDLEQIMKTAPLRTYEGGSDYVYSYLPADYLHLVSDNSATKNLCGAVYAPQTQQKTYYYYKFTLRETPFTTLVLTLDGAVFYTSASIFPSEILDAGSRKFDYLNQIIDIINQQPGYEARYDKLRDINAGGSIVIVSENPFSFSYKYDGDAEVIVAASVKSPTVISQNEVYKEYNNRLVKTEELSSLLRSSHGNTLYYSPLSTLQENKLLIYHNKKFLINGATIDYIRKPKLISLLLNQPCELNVNVHDEIVDNAAKRIVAYMQGQNYQAVAQENLTKE